VRGVARSVARGVAHSVMRGVTRGVARVCSKRHEAKSTKTHLSTIEFVWPHCLERAHRKDRPQ
jgi:hypothetical protein